MTEETTVMDRKLCTPIEDDETLNVESDCSCNADSWKRRYQREVNYSRLKDEEILAKISDIEALKTQISHLKRFVQQITMERNDERSRMRKKLENAIAALNATSSVLSEELDGDEEPETTYIPAEDPHEIGESVEPD